MKRIPALINCCMICLVISSCAPGKKADGAKPVAARYSGGGKWDIEMTLYQDSTYRYSTTPDMMPITSVRRGAYLKNDSFLVLFKNKKELLKAKSYEKLVRVRDNKILMYSEAQENSKDSNFIKDYYTLTPYK